MQFFPNPSFRPNQHISKALNLTIPHCKSRRGLMMIIEFDKNKNAMRFALCAMR
jgi:hypothetical protein